MGHAEPPGANASWRVAPIVVLALLAFAAGVGAFGAVAALGEVDKAFGHATLGRSVAEQMGLSGSVLGLGLAILRIAALGGLPLAVLADRFGRRRTLLWYCGLGLCCTVVAALSPSYWFFVIIFALGRPLLSAAVSIAHVAGAELSSTTTRAGALALITGPSARCGVKLRSSNGRPTSASNRGMRADGSAIRSSNATSIRDGPRHVFQCAISRR